MIKPNEFISAKDAKNIITEIYAKVGISTMAKGSDLSKWFDIKSKTIRKNGGFTKGYIVMYKND